MKLFVMLENEVRGPFDREQLRELAAAGVVTGTTPAAIGGSGPWQPLQEIPECVDLLPARREFQFKRRGFETVNQPGGTRIDVHAAIAAANQGHAPVTPDPAPAGPNPVASNPIGAQTRNEALEIVQETARVQSRFEKPVDLTPRSNRRWRDYLMLMIAVNGLLVTNLILNRDNVVTALFSLGGIAIFSAAVTWIMFFVMDRY